MTKAQYTPGQWIINTYEEAPAQWHKAIIGTHVTGTTAHAFGETLDKCRANAHLIAAAPELLEACKIGLTALKMRNVGYPYGVEFVEKVIAKAEGNQ